MKDGAVTAFWDRHKNQLQQFYPGLKKKRLLLEMKDFAGEEAFFLEEVKKGVPLEYISKKAFFYESQFLITPDVLIPRFETEILVEKALDYCRGKKSIEVADVGVGSGIILLSLARAFNGHLKGVGIDICPKALKVAQNNHTRLKSTFSPKTQITFLKGDRLFSHKKKYHLIVSNPPYIKKQEGKHKVHPQVFKYEPHGALFLEDEEYASWYAEFFKQSLECLYSQGLFLMEGHEDCLWELANIGRQLGMINVEIIRDNQQLDRFLSMRKP